MNNEDQLRDILAKANHEIRCLEIRVQAYENKITMLEEANLRLADRNWELQKRIFECSSWPVR